MRELEIKQIKEIIKKVGKIRNRKIDESEELDVKLRFRTMTNRLC